MRVWRAAILVVSLGGPACAFPDYVFPGKGGDAIVAGDGASDSIGIDSSSTDGGGDGGSGDVADAGEVGPPPTKCPAITEAAACATIGEMPSPDLEVLDGNGEELCALAPRRFAVNEGQHRKPTGTSDAPQQVVVRVGVSARGVHFHVQVLVDPWIVVQDDLVQGDAVEIFVRGVHDPITGKLTTDGGRHYVFVPPTGGRPADGREIRPDGTYGPLSGAFYGIRAVEGGYEVEMRLPWTDLGGQPAPGDAMAFDVGIDVSDDEKIPRRLQSFLYYQAPTGATTCTTTSVAEPSCDTRTWCEAFAYHAP